MLPTARSMVPTVAPSLGRMVWTNAWEAAASVWYGGPTLAMAMTADQVGGGRLVIDRGHALCLRDGAVEDVTEIIKRITSDHDG